jgi:hypothetical protein
VFASIQSLTAAGSSSSTRPVRRGDRRRVPPRRGRHLPPAARPPRPAGAGRDDRDAGAHRRAGHQAVVRRPVRVRDAAVGCARPAAAEPVPVLRDRRRHRPVAGDLAAWRVRTAELSNVYTGDDARVAKVLRTVRDLVADPTRMRALGFCVSVEHADYMARRFREAGIAAASITGETAPPSGRTRCCG